MYVGVHEDRAPGDTKVRFPGATLTREFISGPMRAQSLVSRFERKCEPAWSAGMIPFVSFKPHADDVHAGLWTRHLAELGRWLANAGQQAVVIVYHEPEDNMAGETFASMFNRCRAEMKSAYAGLSVCYSAMAYRWRPSTSSQTGTTDVRPWQRVEADLYGVDVYSGNTWPTDAILPEHPGFLRWYDSMVRPFPGRQWVITERGFQGDSSRRAAAIARETAWLIGSGCSGYIYWNTPGTESDANWVLDADGEAAVRYLVQTIATAPPPIPPQPQPEPTYRPFTGPLAGLYQHMPSGIVVGDPEQHQAWLTNSVSRAIEATSSAPAVGVAAASPTRPSPRQGGDG